MPDRKRGYVQRGKGIQPQSIKMADRYRERQQQVVVKFDAQIQTQLIAITKEACENQSLRLHGIATDASHVHILVSLSTEKDAKDVRQNLKQSLTRRLNEHSRKAHWFGRGGSQKHVADQEHFDYLLGVYLPDHRGVCWFEGKGNDC